jgi:hypothetical protein
MLKKIIKSVVLNLVNEVKKDNRIVQEDNNFNIVKKVCKKNSRKNTLLKFNKKSVFKGIVFSEIIGKPKGRRG